MMNEQQAIQRAKNKDDEAFEQLVSAYERKVYHVAYRFCGNQQDALDVCQEVFLRVFRFLPQFHEESQFSTWLYRITANVCKDMLRRKYAKGELTFAMVSDDEQDFEAQVSDIRYSPESDLERIELQEAIAAGIDSLAPEHREIIIMRDIAGLSYSEIGRCLSLEQGTVKSRIARARDRLRAFLTEMGNISPNVQSKKTNGRDSDESM